MLTVPVRVVAVMPADGVSGQVFVAYGGMVVLATAPGIEARFDSPEETWTAEGLADAVGAHFATREPGITFAADAFTKL